MEREYQEIAFRPGGMSFDSDDEDEPIDDFVFGVPSLDNPTNGNVDQGNMYEPENKEEVRTRPSTGGFGVPAGYVPRHRGSGVPPEMAGTANKYSTPKPANPPMQVKKKITHTKRAQPDSKPIPLEDFKTAVVRGNMDELKRYLDQGVPVNEVLRTGWTALMYAGNYANVKAVSLLLERGADPNYHTDHYSVMMAVCASTSQDQQAICGCAQRLIDYGADINHFDRYHMSAVIYAARDNKPLLVKLLIDAGANKDKQDSRGYSALAWAACRGHVRVVRVLLEEGADTDKACCDGSKPAELARTNGYDNIATILKKENREAILNGEKMEAMLTDEKPEHEEDDAPVSRHSQYGALEMFLLDAELGSLITTFQENQVTFEAFLRFTDNDLQQLGIKQMGVRKKLLDSIHSTHKQEWLPTSLPSIQYNKLVTCPESVAMVVNLSQHASYMGTSAGYITDQIKSHPEILTEAKNSTMVLDLCNKTEEALGKVRVLYSELEALRKVIAMETSQKNYEAPDLIRAPNKASNRHMVRRLTIVGVVSIVGVVAVWKRDLLLDSISNTMHRIVGK